MHTIPVKPGMVSEGSGLQMPDTFFNENDIPHLPTQPKNLGSWPRSNLGVNGNAGSSGSPLRTGRSDGSSGNVSGFADIESVEWSANENTPRSPFADEEDEITAAANSGMGADELVAYIRSFASRSRRRGSKDTGTDGGNWTQDEMAAAEQAAADLAGMAADDQTEFVHRNAFHERWRSRLREQLDDRARQREREREAARESARSREDNQWATAAAVAAGSSIPGADPVATPGKPYQNAHAGQSPMPYGSPGNNPIPPASTPGQTPGTASVLERRQADREAQRMDEEREVQRQARRQQWEAAARRAQEAREAARVELAEQLRQLDEKLAAAETQRQQFQAFHAAQYGGQDTAGSSSGSVPATVPASVSLNHTATVHQQQQARARPQTAVRPQSAGPQRPPPQATPAGGKGGWDGYRNGNGYYDDDLAIHGGSTGTPAIRPGTAQPTSSNLPPRPQSTAPTVTSSGSAPHLTTAERTVSSAHRRTTGGIQRGSSTYVGTGSNSAGARSTKLERRFRRGRGGGGAGSNGGGSVGGNSGATSIPSDSDDFFLDGETGDANRWGKEDNSGRISIPGSRTSNPGAALSSPSSDQTVQAEEYKQIGNERYKAGEYRAALFYYTKAIEHLPNNSTYFANRAAALLMLGRYEESISDCTRSLSLDPTYTRALVRRARCHKLLGNNTAAIRDLEVAVRLDPTNREAIRDMEQLRQSVLTGAPTTAPVGGNDAYGGGAGAGAAGSANSSSSSFFARRFSQFREWSGTPSDSQSGGTSAASGYSHARRTYSAPSLRNAERTHYDVLGVDSGVDAKSLQKAYRLLCLKWHPDKWQTAPDDERVNAENTFKEIGSAYGTLSDSVKRKTYDDELRQKSVTYHFARGQQHASSSTSGVDGDAYTSYATSFYTPMYTSTNRGNRPASAHFSHRPPPASQPSAAQSRPHSAGFRRYQYGDYNN